MTAAEIARQRGVPEGTVRRQLKEALDQLRGTVAAHYGSEARDWRLALLPLATNRHEPLSIASTKGIPMTVKNTALLGFTSAALALGLTLALLRGCTQHAEQAGQGTIASPTASGRTGPAPSNPPPPGSPAPATTAPGAGPPSFAIAAPGDPLGCGEKLAEMRARAAKYTPASAAIFERAKSSPETLVKFAPIIERVIGRWVRRAAYQLECRVAICRVGYVVDSGAEPPIWFTALPGEINELFPKMPFQTDKIETTKDALTGATLKQQWAYFSVPLAPDEEHPFEAAANGTTCGERVAALEKAFDEQREVERRQKEEWEAQRRQVAEMRVNPALTRRLEAAFRSIATDATGAPVGVWECRGASDCRWRGPARYLQSLTRQPMATLHDALAGQGLSLADLPHLSFGKKDKDGKEGESELTLLFNQER